MPALTRPIRVTVTIPGRRLTMHRGTPVDATRCTLARLIREAGE